MYSFDESEESATQTYINVCAAYEQILKRLDVPFIQGKLQPDTFIHSIENQSLYMSTPLLPTNIHILI